MKEHPEYEKRLRRRDQTTLELAIPFRLLPVLGFYKHEEGENPPSKKVLNSRNEEAILNMWINTDRNIEISDASKGLEGVNGIFVTRNVRVHGGSCVFGLDWKVKETMKARKINLDWLKVSVNQKNESIVLTPIQKK